ncbi:MAG: hypothetical protein KAH20_16155 [Methylococcales bacterium]|nr:hypothetical protein [Methylococcales bacterium]
MKKIVLSLLFFISTGVFAETPNFDSSSRIAFFPRVTVDKGIAYKNVELLLRHNFTWEVLKAEKENPTNNSANQEVNDPDFNLSTRIVTLSKVTEDNNVAYINAELLLRADNTWEILEIKREPRTNSSINLTGSYAGSTKSNISPRLNTVLDGTLTQNGDNITGSVKIKNPDLEGQGAVVGKLVGNKVALTATISEVGDSQISFDGTLSNDNKTISGTYTWSAFNDSGSWELILK